MHRRKNLICIFILLSALFLGLFLFRREYIFLDGRIYARNAKQLDLRECQISVEEYLFLRKKIPDCEILWEIPFQGNFFPMDTRFLSVSKLSDEDLNTIACFSALETVDATGCRDYSRLERLRELYPNVSVLYSVNIEGTDYPWDTTEITVTQASADVLSAVSHFPCLKIIHAETCTDLQGLKKLWEANPVCKIFYQVPISGLLVSGDTEFLSLQDFPVTELAQLLPFLPQLKRITLTSPEGTAEELRELTENYPQISFFWETEIFGIPVSSEDQELDLSGISLESTDEIRQAARWLPKLEKVIACNCGIDNEAMASFREEMRDQYKVVWEISLGRKPLRTDATWYSGVLSDKTAHDFRYCEEMVCVDMGHHSISDLSWAAYMPNLKYLIIADTNITDLTPLEGLQHLTYLELFESGVTDLSPLLTCPALEDLNIGGSEIDVETVKRLTWLKRLWWLGCPVGIDELKYALPDTEIVFPRWSYTANGWREGENYYAQRDFMGKDYMVG